jgi:hypothetical protein
MRQDRPVHLTQVVGQVRCAAWPVGPDGITGGRGASVKLPLFDFGLHDTAYSRTLHADRRALDRARETRIPGGPDPGPARLRDPHDRPASHFLP